MTMLSSLVRFGRRQLHTIVSREIIKPSSPTPSHLKTHNLSLHDQLAPDAYVPLVIFYPNYSNIDLDSRLKLLDMKKSLSQTLTQYYPFAGRVAKKTPSFVDCNDDGIEFLEAQNDKPMTDFIRNMQHEDLDQLFPNGQLWKKLNHTFEDFEKDKASLLAVQVNQFACGGIAVAVSLHHKIADGSSLCHFFNDWAIMTRLRSWEQEYVVSPINPYFLSVKGTNLNYQGISLDKSRDNCVTRSFVFPGTKLNDLKLKVMAMTADSEQPIINPTRLEVLNWLLYRCALRTGSFKPTGFAQVTNIRNKMIEPLPKTTIGNLYILPAFSTTDDPNDITPNFFVSQFKKLKRDVQGIKDIKSEFENLQTMSPESLIEEEQSKTDDYYTSTSLCTYPLYGIDFGWGKPIKASVAGAMIINNFVAVDACNGGGIEVFVSLGKQDMPFFQKDPELLSFCESI
ncbi:transferase, Chloramphenicol acetyltransferase-like domain protein [Artemisia annua]|uniref:Transferase, Chloramphenicol acetyltransferase-like domain protein n=1 Tax=Artemisia annua TaxID=35608 RepID=A0A2U1M7M7_ARTAN|nr:transferase, Chloramphenicol acetyltransferase-like domain protein [Artemisia annua]